MYSAWFTGSGVPNGAPDDPLEVLGVELFDTTLPYGSRLGSYEVLALIGAGAWAKEYKVRAILRRIALAIKANPTES
jgi:hypothetical protein